mmetsp:Transcript_15938/g.33334  ORF Transcript_15938/g.33334 Transcript_15938/m.33334 type:complete len:357 (-) Transcript_15938:67-1137(-)
MSSLAATQADGYYVPPEQLDAGAYKPKANHNQYLQRNVVRFELPFDGFCTRCDAIVGKGTRFNAHKAHVGDYFSSKIYEFTTKCRSCAKCEFRIRTNPKDQTFDYTAGIRKKVEEFDSNEAGTLGVIDTEIGDGIYQYKNGDIAISSTDESQNISTRGALHLLEKNAAGHRKILSEHDQMVSLLQINSKMGEDADMNATVRATFRKDRKAKRQRFSDASKIGLGRGIELSSLTEEDRINAKTVMDIKDRTKGLGNHARESERKLFQSKRSEGIFSSRVDKRDAKHIPLENSNFTAKERRGHVPQNRRQKCKIEVNFGNRSINMAGDASKTSKNVALPKQCEQTSLLALSAYGSDSD